MRLALFNDFTHIGGAEQVLLRFCQYLAEEETANPWSIFTVTSAPGPFASSIEHLTGQTPIYLDYNNLKSNWKSPASWRAMGKKLQAFLTETRPDVVLCNSLWSTIATRRQLQNHGIPQIGVIHAAIQPKRKDKQIVFKLAGSLITGKIDGWITVSKKLARQLEDLKIPSETIRIIPNGVQLPASTQLVNDGHWRTRLKIPADGIVVAALGRIHPGKGQAELIRAFKLVAQEHDKVYLVVTGEEVVAPGEEKHFTQELQNYIEQNKLADRVFLTGFVEDATAILNEADIVASASREESFGLAVLEGMAAGRAVVATDIDGHCDLINHEINGMLIPLDAEELFAGAIKKLLLNKNMRLSMGEMARQRAEHFDQRTTMSQWTEFVEQIVRKSRSQTQGSERFNMS